MEMRSRIVSFLLIAASSFAHELNTVKWRVVPKDCTGELAYTRMNRAARASCAENGGRERKRIPYSHV